MYSDYSVFICHRGRDTKHNVVSVLQGMLRLKGIRSFVDYEMGEGSEVNSSIKKAIQSSLLHIVILSKNFKNSGWCLNEVHQIMNMKEAATTFSKPFKVIPVFYDVEFDHVNSFLNEHKPIVTRSTIEQVESWNKALEGLLQHRGFKYNSKTAFQWEELNTIVSEVEAFLISHNILPYPSHYHEKGSAWEIDVHPHYSSVFICHNKEDTQRNVVSVLRGILRSCGIRCFVVDYDKEETLTKFDIVEAIRKSAVHVVFLSPSFVISRQCLGEIVEIMRVRDSTDSSETERQVKVLPVFYDVEPYMVRHQIKHFDLGNVGGSTKERWANALTCLANLKGFEYVTSTEDKRLQQFQWETVHKIAAKVEAHLRKGVIPCNTKRKREKLYQQKLNQVLEALKSEDLVSKDLFVVGVYERNKSQFTELMVEEFGYRFDAICILSNVMEESSQPGGRSHLLRKLYSDLTRKQKEEPLSLDDTTMHRRHYEQLMQNKRCFVVFNGIGNDIEDLTPLLQVVTKNLKNRSLVVLASRFQHVLQEQVKS
ncbi:hypothetical protein KP509_38G012300 [Ceratopteris richardii]|uniref:ADP-ribosyl cyclase/cyclic ADP-ribose hydrolase n=1 Tax=Ceratopteris richardii TaxID=49495 RepID=A0A8T2Q2E3_CERRI|nr:hypothetical protein KP509_38G012300 [Ceratopteris richardii]